MNIVTGRFNLDCVGLGLNHGFYILDGCSFDYAHTWSKSGFSNLLKAFGYIERVVKSDIFSEKTYFTAYVRTIF